MVRYAEENHQHSKLKKLKLIIKCLLLYLQIKAKSFTSFTINSAFPLDLRQREQNFFTSISLYPIMMVKRFVTLFNEVKFGSLNSSKPLAPKADWRDLKTAQEMSLTLTLKGFRTFQRPLSLLLTIANHCRLSL